MPRINKPYIATTLEDLFKVPDESGIVTYDISEGLTENPELDEHGYILFPEIPFPDCSENQINRLLKHPLSIIINPCAAESIYQYYELAALFMDKKGIQLPLPYKLVKKKWNKKLDRFKWSSSYRQNKVSYEQFLNLAKRLIHKLKSRADGNSVEPWVTLEVLIGLENIAPEVKTKFSENDMEAFKINGASKAKIAKIIKPLLKQNITDGVSETLLEKTVDKLAEIKNCNLEQLAVNAFAVIYKFALDGDNKTVISSKKDIACRESIHCINSCGNRIEFPLQVKITDYRKEDMVIDFPVWKLEILQSSKRQFKVTGKILSFANSSEPINIDIRQRTLIKFFLLWLAGENGVLVASKKKKFSKNKNQLKKREFQKTLEEILHHHLFKPSNQENICCLRYDKGSHIDHFPGKALMVTSLRPDTFLKTKTIKPVLKRTDKQLPLLNYPSSLSHESSEYDFEKFCLVSSIIHIEISDDVIKKLLTPLPKDKLYSSNIKFKKGNIPGIIEAIRRGMRSQYEKKKIVIDDNDCYILN